MTDEIQKLIVCGTTRYADEAFRHERRRGFYISHIPSFTLTHRTLGTITRYASSAQRIERFHGARWNIILHEDSFYALATNQELGTWREFKEYHDQHNKALGIKPATPKNIIHGFLQLTLVEMENLLSDERDLTDRFRAVRSLGPLTDITHLQGVYGQQGINEAALDQRIYQKMLAYIGNQLEMKED